MPDIQAAAALVSSVKTAIDMVSNAVGMRDDIKLQTVQADLKRQLLEVLDLALTAKTDQFAFVEREEALKKEVAQLKEWKASEGEYKLEEIPPGAFAFVSQPTSDPGAQEVWLCPACFELHRRSPLQNDGHAKGDFTYNIWKCIAPGCKASLMIEADLSPGNWRHRVEEILIGRQIDAAARAKHLEALKKRRDESS